MRVLLEQECAAVAGGDVTECVQDVTAALTFMGMAAGASAGAAAGGVGAIPGAGIGGALGGSVAAIVGPALCRWEAKQESEESESEEEEEEAEESSGGGGAVFQTANTQLSGGMPTPVSAHQFLVIAPGEEH